ncbi:PepSY-associated TM helix domain-containing protein [Aliidiomarina shirensis]|nr:PepSY-associated TM helix domain-containing protein [Aliidiomarina shirensis]
MRMGSMVKWHWVSSALCLAGLLLFAITGITLNHAQSIEAKPRTVTIEKVIPEALLEQLAAVETEQPPEILPREMVNWARQELRLNLANKQAEWSDFDIYFSLPKPGGDAWLSIDRYTGEVIYEDTSRGTIAYLNDLHKGRHTGLVWQWFLDIFAVACVIFSVTGLLLLHKFARNRWSTWPLVSLGVVLPAVLLLLFTHG